MRTTESRDSGASAHFRTVEQESTTGLFSRLFNDVTALLRNEVALAKSELREAAVNTKQGVVGIASGGAVLFAGFLFLLGAATLGLAHVVPLWLAALIVGAAAALIGYGMVKAAQKKLDPAGYRMERTRAALRQDSHIVRRAS